MTRFIPLALFVFPIACAYTQPAMKSDPQYTVPAESTGELAEAYNAYNQNHYWDAIVVCDNVILNNEGNAEAHLLRGICYCARDDIQPGVENFDAALRLNPAYCGDEVPNDRAFDIYERTIRGLDTTSILKPRYAKAFVVRALDYERNGDSAGSLRCCNEALRMDPSLARAYAVRGNAYLDAGSLDKAFDDYRHAVQIQPAFASTIGAALQQRANAERSRGNDAAAERCVEMASTLRG